MNWNYIRDGFNPRGAAYSAAERAAAAAQITAEAQQDMLELQLASSEQERSRIVARIAARRQGQARRRAWWQRLDLIAAILFVGGIAYYMLTPSSKAPQSAVTNDTPAHVSKVPDDANAPVRQAQAPATVGNIDALTKDDPDPKGSQWVIDTDNKYGSNYPVGRHSTKVIFGYGLMYKADPNLPLEEGMGEKALEQLIAQCKTSTPDYAYALSRAYEDTLERLVQDNAIISMIDRNKPKLNNYQKTAQYMLGSDITDSDYIIMEDSAKHTLDVSLNNRGANNCLNK